VCRNLFKKYSKAIIDRRKEYFKLYIKELK